MVSSMIERTVGAALRGRPSGGNNEGATTEGRPYSSADRSIRFSTLCSIRFAQD